MVNFNAQELIDALQSIDKEMVGLNDRCIGVTIREAGEIGLALDRARTKLGIVIHNLQLFSKWEQQEFDRLDSELEERQSVLLANENDSIEREIERMMAHPKER